MIGIKSLNCADVAAGLWIIRCVLAGEKQQRTPPAAPLGLVAVDSDLLELKRGNLLLEREKLNLEIQILQAKVAKLSRADAV